MAKIFFTVLFLMAMGNFFAQGLVSANGFPLNHNFTCFGVSVGCVSLSNISCSNPQQSGDWSFDPLDPPTICLDPNNAQMGPFCKLEHTIAGGEPVANQYLKFYLAGNDAVYNLSFMVANYGNTSGLDSDLNTRMVVQIGNTTQYIDVPPYDPNVRWFPVDLVVCGSKNKRAEITISLEVLHEPVSASVSVGIDGFALSQIEATPCPDECPECSSLLLKPNEDYLLSAWVKETNASDHQDISTIGYEYANIQLSYEDENGPVYDGNGVPYVYDQLPSGAIIDGWQRIIMPFRTPEVYTESMTLSIDLRNDGGNHAFFDDIRIHPLKSNLKSFVYDQNSQKLLAELDENNYATFYEYDGEGGLVRVKKETEKGVFTIQETRSSNKKRPQE